jgi:long-chain-fatty-acid--CoA ligase ACSBG
MFTTNIKSKGVIKVEEGDFEPMTVPEMFHDTVSRNRNNLCISWKSTNDANLYHNLSNSVDNSRWVSMTYSQTEEEIYKFAGACLNNGLESKDVVVVMGYNSPQWFLSFHGTIQAGGVVAGCYSTNLEDTCLYLVENSNAKFVVVENWKHGQKFLKALDDSESNLSKIIVWSDTSNMIDHENVISFQEFINSAPKNSKEIVSKVEQELNASECCNLIYTSGTTGNPKGVMLSHDNMTWDVRTFLKNVEEKNNYVMGNEQVLISYLPLSHIAAQMLDFMVACATGGSLYFATPDALKGGLLPLLQQIRPTFLFGVPRVWEKIMDGMKAKGANNSFFKRKIVDMAKWVALNRNRALANSAGNYEWPATTFGLYGVFNKLVYSKVKAILGLDRCALFGSGAAPISENVLSYFWSLDIPIVEGFGMSETTGISTMCVFPQKVRLGTVGFGICKNMIKISEEQEILLRGRHIMMGYLNNEEKTRETFDEQGYLKTGDMGSLRPSPDGEVDLLTITGRIKELVITAGGENVAPVPIEDKIKFACPLISNVMLIGDKRKFLSILVTLRSVINPDTLIPTNDIDPTCRQVLSKAGVSSMNVKEVSKEESVKQLIQGAVDSYNRFAASNAQKVQKFVILSTDFSVPGGELTETQKLKRRIVLEKYSEQIESMYSETSTEV